MFKDAETLVERKAIGIELKADSEGHVSGYASRFGEVDKGGDIVVKGAYANSLAQGRKPKMLWQHNPSEPIGVWDEIKEDDTGLYVAGRVLDTISKGREVKVMLEAGVIDGMSIGYRTVRSGRDEKGHRLLQEVDLWEVSMVTFPMQESARIDGMKAMVALQDGNAALLKRYLEDALREAGASNTEAKAASAAGVGKLVAMREAGAGLSELAQFMRENHGN